jgi:predicted ATPase/DNA-binding winged helix-turn-helix (wHTH) protein
MVTFGSFRLIRDQRLLLLHGHPVTMGDRALAVLIALTDRPGEVVSHHDLMSAVWPDSRVSDVSLRFQVALLRRTLGQDRGGGQQIATVIGRGYRFIAPIGAAGDANITPQAGGEGETLIDVGEMPRSGAAAPAQELVARLPRGDIVGRDDLIAGLITRLPQRRLITIVGPGGIGKTTVAIAAAAALAGSYRDGTCFIDLAPVATAHVLSSLLIAACGLQPTGAGAEPDFVDQMRDRKMLLVLDNCEHLIEAIAVLVERLYRLAPHVHILATSRERLRIRPERVVRLPPLELPGSLAKLTAAAVRASPAVRLFVDRATAALGKFDLDDRAARTVADLCNRLDGLPLAIELAAGCVAAFGLEGVASLVGDRFLPLGHGRRTAARRHRTMGDAIDWSYRLLSEPERQMMRDVAIFPGSFSLVEAQSLLADSSRPPGHIAAEIGSLAAKSLLSGDLAGAEAMYRMLDLTRDFARRERAAAGESQASQRHHALHTLATAGQGRDPAATTRYLENVRSALTWTFSPGGEPTIGVALTIATVPLWIRLSLNEECRIRVESALAHLSASMPGSSNQEMQLHAALAGAAHYTTAGQERKTAWTRCLHLAETLDDADYQLQALWGLWANSIDQGQFRPSLDLAKRFSAVAVRSNHPTDRPIANRMIGFSAYFLGHLSTARKHIERMLAEYVSPQAGSHLTRFQFDQAIMARVGLAEVLWLLGFPDQAMAMVQRNVVAATESGHGLTLAFTLARSACPVALLAGELTTAAHYADMLAEPGVQAADRWRLAAVVFKGLIMARRGDIPGGLAMLSPALAALQDRSQLVRKTALLGDVADVYGLAGETARGLGMVQTALEYADQHEELCCLPELLRIKGRLLGDAHGADAVFHQAMVIAQDQGALSCALRAALDLSRLEVARRRPEAVSPLLEPLLQRFTEGFETPDLRAARDLLRSVALRRTHQDLISR